LRCVYSREVQIFKAAVVKRSTGHTQTHTTAEQTTHTNTERAAAQRRLIVEVVVAAPKIVVARNDFKPILKCSISRKQKACSCAPSMTGAAYARAYFRVPSADSKVFRVNPRLRTSGYHQGSDTGGGMRQWVNPRFLGLTLRIPSADSKVVKVPCAPT